MTIQEALKSSGIARADAEVLLCDLLRKERLWLILHGKESLTSRQTSSWNERVKRRKRHEPVAYITGKKEFYGRVFSVSPATLIPRPATEILIELVIDFLECGKEEIRAADEGIVAVSEVFSDMRDVRAVVDVGTGSGCIAVTIKRLRPDLSVFATDISAAALKVARKNAKAQRVDIQFFEGNLLEPVNDVEEPFVVVANPPYIPSKRKLDPDVSEYEPSAALFGGTKGNEVITELLKQCRNNQYCRGIALECEEKQLIEVRKCRG